MTIRSRIRAADRRTRLALMRIAVLVLGTVAMEGSASAFELSLPLQCTPGADCWVFNYVDIDPGPGVRDGACGARSYGGHDGTDFAIRDMEAMTMGVAVRASAAGTVKGVRDGIRDVDVNLIGRDGVKDKECGNGVVLDHGQGWETQYCHMRQGSIAVKKGDRVAEGQTLGLVGLSGLTEFPHVHLSVRHQGKALDPFTGRAQDGTCGVGADGQKPAPLWNGTLKRTLVYEPVVLFNAGITGKEPAREDLRGGGERRPSLPQDAPVMVVWVEASGVRDGDEMTLRLHAPDGRIVAENTRTLKVEAVEQRAYQSVYTGKRRPGAAWPTGTYRGTITLTRKGGTAPIERRIETQVEVR